MDILFIVVCLILGLVIAFIYIFNHIPYTTDINKLADNILTTDPTIRNFTLGRNPSDPNTFLNAVIANTGILTTAIDPYPVRKDGQYFIIKEHGKIEEYDDGFRIEGIDLINFKCPVGYHGANCELDNICGADDTNGTLKRLTYTQFNALELYRNDTPVKNFNVARDNGIEPTHPRLRVKCLDNLGNFELQACPDNSLLNKELQCQVYDVCQDNLDGYKHNYQITSNPSLESNEYYICRNRKSEKMKCAESTIFSNVMKACTSQSVCVGKGHTTIPLNDKAYIQCRNDLGIKIDCADGGVLKNDETGQLSCKITLCRPEIFTFDDDDGRLHYDYGQVTCSNDGVPTTTICNTTKSPRVYRLEWAELDTYTIDDWPSEILKNGQCVVPTDKDANDILFDPIVNVRYTDAMPEKHPYDLKKRQFVCDGYAFRWDYDEKQTSVPEYDNNHNMPNRSHRILYSGAPCQNDVIKPYPFRFHIEEHPKEQIYIYVTEPVHIEPRIGDQDLYYWPVQTGANEFKHTQFKYKNHHLAIETYQTSLMPLGFKSPSNRAKSNKLELVGYPNAPSNEKGQHYFIASGKLEMVQLYQPTLVRSYKYQYCINNLINTALPGEFNFAIDMAIFTHKVSITDDHMTSPQKCIIDPSNMTIKYKGVTLNLGYSVFHFRSLVANAVLTYDSINCSFSPMLNPFIQF